MKNRRAIRKGRITRFLNRLVDAVRDSEAARGYPETERREVLGAVLPGTAGAGGSHLREEAVTIPKYDSVIRELTYAIRDLASAVEIAAQRQAGQEAYSVVDEHNCLQLTTSRLAGALGAARQHEQRLANDVLIAQAGAAETGERQVAAIRAAEGQAARGIAPARRGRKRGR